MYGSQEHFLPITVGFYSENKNKEKKEKKMDDKITFKQYNILSEAIRNYFGKYSGYAQQFLYYYMRQNASKKW